MPKKKIRIGLIGYQFMGKAHSNAYRQAPHFFDLEWEPVLKVICGRHESAVKSAAEKYGWEEYETDWRKVVERKDVDLIDVSTPGHLHAPISLASAQGGKAVWCEKPLANTLQEAHEMHFAVKKAGVFHALFHNYRFCPAVALAKKMIENGELGEIYHFRAVYLQDWIVDPHFPLVWRLQKEFAGSGALGDIAAHSIDLARYLVGEIKEVVGCLNTFIKERPLLAQTEGGLSATASEQKGQVTVDDACAFLTRFHNGAMGTFEASRFAVGRKNYNRFEINGSKGSLVFNLERMNELEYYNNSDPEGKRGFRVIQVTEKNHPFVSPWWPPGHIIGYEHTFIHLVADGLQKMAKGENPSPNFDDGLANQKVLDAVERSAQTGQWEKIE